MPDNLPELRDIHMYDGVSVWPLGYGWWVIIVGIILLFAAIKLAIYLRRKSKKLYALYLIKNIADSNIINATAQISEILRRICIYKYPQAVALSGGEWQNFLQQHCKKELDNKLFNLLINAPFMSQQTQGYAPDDLNKLRDYAVSWIGENL